MSQKLATGRLLLVPLVALLSLSLNMAFGDDDYEVRAAQGGGSGSWTPDEWTETGTYRNIDGYSDRPDEEILKEITVKWQPPDLDALGNFCIIRGQLRVPSDTPQQMRPVDWFQGVTVYMAQQPGATRDWSKGMNQEDTLSETGLVSPSGRFALRLDVREAQYDRARRQPYQFGLALATSSGIPNGRQNVYWTSRAPAIPATVQMLDLPAGPELSPELNLVNEAARWPFSDPNGVKLIRAVNALQRLGKENALATIETYVEMTNTIGYFDEGNIVFWIIRVLFEPIRSDDRIPAPLIAVALDDRESDRANWPLGPMAIVNDIPFMLGHRIGMGGSPELPSSHIEWARRHGIIRDEPLRPSANPLQAAAAITLSRQFAQLSEYSREEALRLVRAQSMAMVEGLLDSLPALNCDGSDEKRQEDAWKLRLAEAEQRQIHWDVHRESFSAKIDLPEPHRKLEND